MEFQNDLQNGTFGRKNFRLAKIEILYFNFSFKC